MTFQICSRIHNALRLTVLISNSEFTNRQMTILVKVPTQENTTIFLNMCHKMITYQSKWTVILEYDE